MQFVIRFSNFIAEFGLNEAYQYAFCAFDKTKIYPVPNKWGKQGWTLVNLDKVEYETLKNAILTAFCTIAPEKIAKELISKII